MRDWFDFSQITANYVSGLGFPTDRHAGIVGNFKDKIKVKQVYKLIALKPKSYLMLTVKATMYYQIVKCYYQCTFTKP